MPTEVTVVSNYAGEAAGDIFSEAFNGTDAVSRGLVTFYPDVRHQIALRKIEGTDGTTDYACGFTPAGAISLSENQLTIKTLKHDIQVCVDDFRTTWNGEGEILDAIQVYKLDAQADKIQEDIWYGDASVNGQFGGLMPVIKADVATKKTDSVAITKDNVQAELEKFTATFAPKVRKKKDFKILVASNVIDAYDKLLISQGIANGLGGDSMATKYGKYMLEEVVEFEDNEMLAARTRNLVVGSYRSNLLNNLEFADTRTTLLDGNVRMKMVYGGATGVHDASEIYLYSEAAGE